MEVEAGAAGRRGPAPWWDEAFSLSGDAGLKLGRSLGLKLGLGMKVELGMGLKPVVGLKLGAETRRSGSP